MHKQSIFTNFCVFFTILFAQTIFGQNHACFFYQNPDPTAQGSGYFIRQSPQNDFFLASSDQNLIKINESGEKIWAFDCKDWIRAIFPLDDGGVLVATDFSKSYCSTNDDISFSRMYYLDKNGILIWQKMYALSNSSTEEAKIYSEIMKTDDTYFIFSKNTLHQFKIDGVFSSQNIKLPESNPSNLQNIDYSYYQPENTWIACYETTDSIKTITWNSDFSTVLAAKNLLKIGKYARILKIDQSNQRLVLFYDDNGIYQIHKLNESGDLLFSKNASMPIQYLSRIFEINTNYYLDYFYNNKLNVFDSQFNQLYDLDISFQNSNLSGIKCLLKTDNKIVFAGKNDTNAPFWGFYDCKNTSSTEENMDFNLQIRPSITQNWVSIQSPKTEISEIRVLNSSGNPIFHSSPKSINENFIDFSNEKNGLYFIQILTQNGWICRKIVKI